MAIEWKTIEQPFFDRVVETIAHRHYAGTRRVNVIEGRGGDGGRDIEVFNDERLESVLQLKCFPEGFSGGFSSRRRQIMSSWNSLRGSARRNEKVKPLWPNGKPERWILVVPCKLSDGERKFLRELVKDSGVQHAVWDLAWLDDWLSKHPDVSEYFTTDLLMDRAKLFGQEKAILAGGVNDLDDRVRGLKGVTDAMDPDWTFDFSVVGETRTHTLRAKHPAAPEVSPLGIALSAVFGPEHAETKESLDLLFQYGTPGSVMLPPGTVQETTFTGPAWFSEMPPIERITITPVVANSGSGPTKIRLRFLDDEGRILATHESDEVRVGGGSAGGSLTAQMYRTLKFTLLLDANGRTGTIAYQVDFLGAAVTDAVRAAKLLRDLSRQGTLEISLDGKVMVAIPVPGSQVDQETEWITDSLGDLEVVERETGSLSKVPLAMTVPDRVLLRATRLILEGKCTYLPGAKSVDMTLNGSDSQELRELAGGKPVAAKIVNPDMHIMIGDEDIAIGVVVWWHPHSQVTNPEEVLRALDEGRASGMPMTLRGDGTPFRALLAHSLPSDGTLPTPVPWALSGVKEPCVDD